MCQSTLTSLKIIFKKRAFYGVREITLKLSLSTNTYTANPIIQDFYEIDKANDKKT